MRRANADAFETVRKAIPADATWGENKVAAGIVDGVQNCWPRDSLPQTQ